MPYSLRDCKGHGGVTCAEQFGPLQSAALRLAGCSTECYTWRMASSPRRERVFKTAWFAKAARKAQFGDDELCAAVAQARAGQCDDLGNGVYKKRVSRNLYRSIILAKGGRYWISA